MQLAGMINSLVPISRFNKGEASKIFDEVALTGMKVAIKNNKPACVMLSPEVYEDLAETLWELSIIPEIEKRIDEDLPGIPWEEVKRNCGITDEDIAGWEDVEIE